MKDTIDMAQTLLLIEDDHADALLFREMINKQAPAQFELTHLEKVEEIDDIPTLHQFDVVVLDMNLLGLSGLDAVDYIKERNHSVPIIIMTGASNDKQASQAADVGVQDYLVKGNSSSDVVCRSIRYSIQRKKYEEKVAYLLCHDRLTGLVNGELFRSQFDQLINQNHHVATFFIDLDNFKDINDLYGHDAGNLILIETAKRLRELVGEHGLITRLGNDEFMIVMDDLEHEETCTEFAETIEHALSAPFLCDDHSVQINASIGIALHPDGGDTSSKLMKHSEIALHKAKEQGGGHHQLFNSALHEQVVERIQLTNCLRSSMQQQDFSLHYHPKVNLRSDEVVGVEALIRWRHPERGPVSPVTFIPLAEEAGVISDITSWVLQTACEHHHEPFMQDLNVAVNVSALQLQDEQIVTTVRRAIEQNNMPPERLILEITETAVMKNAKKALDVLAELKLLGVKLHIDDFGTGYSSIDYLRRFPVDALKIDRSFVKDMIDNVDDNKIVHLLIDLAHDLGLQVVAEGVESIGHANRLRMMQCDMAQGFCYCQPLSVHDFGEWLATYNP